MCSFNNASPETLRPSNISEALLAAWENGTPADALVAHYKESMGWERLPQAGRVACLQQLHALGCERNAHTLALRWRRALERAFAAEVEPWRMSLRIQADAERGQEVAMENVLLRQELRINRRANQALQVQAAALHDQLEAASLQLAGSATLPHRRSACPSLAAPLEKPKYTGPVRPHSPTRPPSSDSIFSLSSDITLCEYNDATAQ